MISGRRQAQFHRNVRQLPAVTDDDQIFRAAQSQYSRHDILLRCFVDDDVVEYGAGSNRIDDGVRAAAKDR